MNTRVFLGAAVLVALPACSFVNTGADLADPAAVAAVERQAMETRFAFASTARHAAESVELVARGSAPAWSLTVSGERIVLDAPNGGGEMVFPYQAPTMDGSRLAYATSGGGTPAHRMVLRVSSKPCTDPATGERFPHTAYLRLDGVGFQGCAAPGESARERALPFTAGGIDE